MSAFDRDAQYARALLEAQQGAGPCPACGAAPDIKLFDAGWLTRSPFIVGEISCSARCFQTDPAAYLSAIASKQAAS